MQLTQIATNIGDRDNASGICSLLSLVAQRQVEQIQQQLSHKLGDGLWFMPASSLHITLCEIFQSRLYHEDKELLFERHKEDYESAIKHVVSVIEPIKVNFNRVEVSSQAIIIRGSDDRAFDAIRTQLVELLPLPSATKQPPTIVHSTIARFTRELDLKTVQSVIAQLNISFTETITEFQLLHNVSPHMLSYEVVARYPLTAK